MERAAESGARLPLALLDGEEDGEEAADVVQLGGEDETALRHGVQGGREASSCARLRGES